MADGQPFPVGMGPGARPPVPPGAAGGPGASQPEPPPTGASPATMPVANRGEHAAGMAHLAVAVHVLEQALPLLGMGTEAGRDVHSVLAKIAKHTPPGAVSSGIENSILQKLMMSNRQNAMNVAAMRGGAAPPGAPPGAAAAGGAQPPQPPRPATPPGMASAA
jgi:hypothetical protein